MTVRVLQGDCREIIKGLPDASVDVVIADPPYGETRLAWDIWPSGWLAELPRLMKPSASLWMFGSLRMFLAQAGELAGWMLAQEVIWEKHNGSASHADRFRRVHETIVQLYPRGRRWGDVFKNPLFTDDAVARSVRRQSKPQHWGQIGPHFYATPFGGDRLLRSVWCVPSEHGRAEHPTQKPLAVIAPLLAYSCPRGGAVLDPFAGSGTTGVAAAAADMDAILIDANPEYVDMARRRLAGAAPLFAESTT